MFKKHNIQENVEIFLFLRSFKIAGFQTTSKKQL